MTMMVSAPRAPPSPPHARSLACPPAAKMDAHNRAFFLHKCCDRWLSVRLELMGNTLVFAAALFAVINRGTLYAGYAGISIDYALQITMALGMLVGGWELITH